MFPSLIEKPSPLVEDKPIILLTQRVGTYMILGIWGIRILGGLNIPFSTPARAKLICSQIATSRQQTHASQPSSEKATSWRACWAFLEFPRGTDFFCQHHRRGNGILERERGEWVSEKIGLCCKCGEGAFTLDSPLLGAGLNFRL